MKLSELLQFANVSGPATLMLHIFIYYVSVDQ